MPAGRPSKKFDWSKLDAILQYNATLQDCSEVMQVSEDTINCGHATVEAIKKLGWKECAVDYQEFKSESEEYANMTADNELARYAQLNLDQMKIDIEEIDFDIDTEFLGIALEKDVGLDLIEEKDDDIEEDKKFILEIQFPNDVERMNVNNDLLSKGYITRVK